MNRFNALGNWSEPSAGELAPAGDKNMIALVKGVERYIFLFDESSRQETAVTMCRFAAQTDLSFSWADAAILSQKLRQLAATKEGER